MLKYKFLHSEDKFKEFDTLYKPHAKWKMMLFYKKQSSNYWLRYVKRGILQLEGYNK